MTSSTVEVRNRLRQVATELRRKTAPLRRAATVASGSDVRTGLFRGETVNRLVIHLQSRGCGWVDTTGGCTMCGFYGGTTTGNPVSAEEYVEQFDNEVRKYDLSDFRVIGIYNAGNLLNESEVPYEAVKQIARRIRSMPFERISIESKIDYLSEERCRDLVDELYPKELEVAVGVESMNPTIRDLCVNKPISERKLAAAVNMLHALGARTKAYLLLKPPFLTEKEALDDFVTSVAKVKDLGFDAVDCEATTVERNTVVELLRATGNYRPPWLWTIVEVLRKSHGLLDRPLYLSPFRYIVPSIDDPRNCPACTDLVRRVLLEDYSREFDIGVFAHLECRCLKDWNEELRREDARPLEQRIADALTDIEVAGLLEHQEAELVEAISGGVDFHGVPSCGQFSGCKTSKRKDLLLPA